MKIAGRKNDGAWFRANKVIQNLTPSQRASFIALLTGMASMAGWYEIINQFQALAGIGSGDDSYIADPDALCTAYATNGIPRQAWYGILSYDTYTKSGTSPDFVYTPDHQHEAFLFGHELRKLVKDFVFARRAALDLGNIGSREAGNPSGIADATEGT